ncbi:MAG: hypothetical protein HETSPECPRED_002670 [Heterodermia speciosa]|uniref:DUF6590 domain-containing protein n=1 Tax=Heterodermia speciosa TaxID=116794 RepID=A0A8H3PI86_9LECA|nr:MAG: hypothetical protein HETSPECPRED_002670 [Heterodermia speciosa]
MLLSKVLVLSPRQHGQVDTKPQGAHHTWIKVMFRGTKDKRPISFHPNISTLAKLLSPYGPSPGSNTAQGARSNQNYQSPYLQPATRPSDVTPTVAPGVPTSGSPPAGEYRNDRSHYEDETVEDNITAELVRGTKGPYELLDPNFKVIRDHWRFFVVGRVFKYLSWEPQGNGNPNERSGNSVQKYQTRSSKLGQEAFAKVYRYVVVRARPKQGYSMCLRITTHNGHGTVGKLIMQREHSIIYTGEEAPARLPEEKKLNKDPIQVIPVENAEPLDPLSRINYAKPYPIEHNVKVCEVGMVAPRDVRKINAYYQQESGYETERPQQEPERRRRESSSAVSKEPERRRRESSSSMNKEPERKVRREQRRDSRR